MTSRSFALAYNPDIGAFELVSLVVLRLQCEACEAEVDMEAIKRPEDPVQYGAELQGVACPECGVGELSVIPMNLEDVREDVRALLAEQLASTYDPLPPIPESLYTITRSDGHLMDCEGPGCGASCGCACHAYE